MIDLQTLPNIGPKLARDLNKIGVSDVETLRRMGAEEIIKRLSAAGLRDCTHAARAVEGALAGVRWTTGKPA
jgi:DNA transformation protein